MFNKLSAKLIFVIAIILLSVSVAAFYFLSESYKQNQITSFYSRVKKSNSELVSLATNALLNAASYKIDSVALNVMASHTPLAYAVIIDKNDKILYSYKKASAEKNLYLKINQTTHRNLDNNILKGFESLLYKENSIGSLYYGYSLINLKNELSNYNSFLIIVLSGIFLIAILLSSGAILFNTKSLAKIAEFGKHISAGNLSEKIKVKGKDEIGAVSKIINNLTDDLEQANSKIERLNREMKHVFKDKIGELNLEINKRRLAETSLKQSEEQLRLLFELAPVGMVISSPDNLIIRVNQAFADTLGYKYNELVNWPMWNFTHKDDRETDLALHKELLEHNVQAILNWPEFEPDKKIDWDKRINLHKKLLKEKHSDISFEKRFIHKNGKIIFAIVKSILLRDDKGSPHHFVEQVVDITERKLAEKELIVARDKAQESDRLKSAFLAQMSHEIRTPLNVILNITPIISDELSSSLDDELNELLNSVNSAGKRLQRTIDLILNMSSVQSGNYEPDFELINLENEFHGLIREFRNLCEEKGLILSYKCTAPNPEVSADHYTITQIFQNLVDNAIKYTKEGKIEITISEPEEGKLTVAIKDTGIGISKKYLASIFSPFSQEDVGQKREYEGNGLGLALVKKYVEINNAQITVESEKGVGSNFSVVFNRQNNPPVA